MNKRFFISVVLLSALMPAVHANPVSRRATITGGGGNGRCTIEVNVDGTAEIEISGDMGLLTTTSGQPAAWRRFQCNRTLPPNPADFRFNRLDGRGNMRLAQDPRSTGGRAVIQINDPKGGRNGYTFDLQWSGRGPGGWTPTPLPPGSGQGPFPGPRPDPLPGPGPEGFPIARGIRICQDAVTDRLNQDGFSYITFNRTVPDDNPGRHDWVTGFVSGKRYFGTTRFLFSCSVDFRSGTVRSVDVRRRW